jgi:hypothetical protein
MKKTNNKLSKWCKSALMLPAVAVVLTFASCQNDDLFPEAVDASQSETGVSPLRASRQAVTTPYTITFENVSPSLLAGPTAEGENCYEGYTGVNPARYIEYYDAATGLHMGLNPDAYNPSEYNMWGGGIFMSRWNNMATAGWQNQCSVYYSDPVTGDGGYDGSQTFAVHYGYKDTSGYGVDARSYITFKDTSKTCVFDYFYVCNNTYATLSMTDGDQFSSRPLDYAHQDWFKLIIEGIRSDGTSAGTVEFYLADFREEGVSPGILYGWQRVDLDTLGAVTALRFDMDGSLGNAYGLTIPAYFCFDDLTVILP